MDTDGLICLLSMQEKLLEQELLQTKAALAVHVNAWGQIQKLSTHLSQSLDLNLNLKHILETVVELNTATYALIFLYNPGSGYLETIASLGFDADTLKIMSRIRATPNSGACGMAYINKKKVILEDLKKYPTFQCYQGIAPDHMFTAVHSTPIIAKSGEPMGVISLFFKTVHKPSLHEEQLADLCARYTATAIETNQAEKNLQDSEIRFRTMADNAPIMVWVTDLNGFCTFLSKSWYDFTGLTPETGLGFGWLQAIDPEDREDIEKIYRGSHEQRTPFQFEYRLCHQKKEYRRVLDAVAPWFGLDGEFLGYIGAVIDISERMHLQQSVQSIDDTLQARVKMRTAQLETQATRLLSLTEQIVSTKQRERKRIAIMLHDHLQQILVAGTFQLAEASYNMENKQFDRVTHFLNRGNDFLKEAIRSARSLTTELLPPVLYEKGLTNAFEWLAQKFKKEYNLEIILNMDDTSIPLLDSLKVMVFESVKELFFNVVKHAKVQQAKLTIKLIFNHVLHICVEDKGVGFDLSRQESQENSNSPHEEGFGFFSMRERLKILNAACEMTSALGKGTKVEMRIPISPFLLK